MKRAYLVLCIMFLAVVSMIVAKPAQAQATPAQITNCQDLQNINNNLRGYYQLANDVDCSATKTWNNGFGFLPIGTTVSIGTSAPPAFTGVLDGNGHAINNLYINASNVSIGTSGPVSVGTIEPIGMISVALGATVMNLKVQNASVNGGAYANYVAIIAGEMTNSTAVNVQVQGTIQAGKNASVGAITDIANNTNIIQTSANVKITGGDFDTGGLVGIFEGGSISQSSTNGVINSSAITGGLVGSVSGGTLSINNSYSTSEINYNCSHPYTNYTFGVGGLIGDGYTSVVNVTNSYAAGPITVTGSKCDAYQLGGLVGHASTVPTVVSSYWDKKVTGQTASVGSPVTAGLTTAQMFTTSSYANWDFMYTWVGDGSHYPVLNWQEQPQINLWDVFSGAIQASVFELINTPANTVDWTSLNYANLNGVNWTDLLVLSKPFVWNNQPVTSDTINWSYLTGLSDQPMNWTDVGVLSRSGIDWSSANPLVRSGINWSDWVVACRSGVNWNAIATLSNLGINWNNVGTLNGSINWTDLADMTHQNVNWAKVSILSQQNVNWDNVALLSSVNMSPDNLYTLRTIGVNPNEYTLTIPTDEVGLYINGTGVGTIVSTPAIKPHTGLSCTKYSSTLYGGVCSAAFTDKQPVTLSFYSPNHSMVTNWGVYGCASGASTCKVTPDTDINIGVTVTAPVIYTISASTGANGWISPAGAVKVYSGSNQTFTMTPEPGYGVYQVVVDGEVLLIPNVTAKPYTYTFNDVTRNHAIQVAFKKLLIISTSVSPVNGGKISPVGPVIVTPESYATFTFTPNAGYQFSEILVDGRVAKATLGVNNVYTYTFTDVTASHTIEAVFKR